MRILDPHSLAMVIVATIALWRIVRIVDIHVDESIHRHVSLALDDESEEPPEAADDHDARTRTR